MNHHILILRFHLHLSIHGNHAPDVRTSFHGAVMPYGRFHTTVDGRHHDTPLVAQTPFVPYPERLRSHQHRNLPFTLLHRFTPCLLGLLFQSVGHLFLYFTHGTHSHRPVSLAPALTYEHLHGLSRPCALLHMVVVPLVVHHQQRVVFKIPDFPIHPTLVTVQQAHHIHRGSPYHHPLEPFLRFTAERQFQIQPVLSVPGLGRHSLDLIQLLCPCAQVAADIRNLKVTEMHQLRHMGIQFTVLHVDEELPSVGFAFLILDSG